MPAFEGKEPYFGSAFHALGDAYTLFDEAFPIELPALAGGMTLADLPEDDAGEQMEFAHDARVSNMHDLYRLFPDMDA